MLPNDKAQTGSLNLNEMHDTALNVVGAVCSIVSRPVELILRPWHGTRYFPVPVIFLSSVMMVILPAFSAMASDVTAMIPFGHASRPVGMFGIGSMAELYFLLTFAHSIRIYRRMMFMHLEEHSGYEGAALPFFQLIPWGRSFWKTRVILEPVFVFLLATVLQDVFIIQSSLATYLYFAAAALAMKSAVNWYRSWEYLRALIDAKNAGPILANLMDDRASDEELASINLASFPKDVSPEIRAQAASSIARAYSQTN